MDKITPEAIKKANQEGLAVPTVTEALKSEEDLAYLATEVGKILETRPEDTQVLNDALQAAERFLELETDKLNAKELMQAIGGSALGTSIGLLILSALFPLTLPVAGGMSAGGVALSGIQIAQAKSQKRDMQKRLAALRGLLSRS